MFVQTLCPEVVFTWFYPFVKYLWQYRRWIEKLHQHDWSVSYLYKIKKIKTINPCTFGRKKIRIPQFTDCWVLIRDIFCVHFIQLCIILKFHSMPDRINETFHCTAQPLNRDILAKMGSMMRHDSSSKCTRHFRSHVYLREAFVHRWTSAILNFFRGVNIYRKRNG